MVCAFINIMSLNKYAGGVLITPLHSKDTVVEDEEKPLKTVVYEKW